MIWPKVVTGFSLLASFSVIFVQRTTIHSLQNQLDSSSIRTKRSTHDNAVYVPVYAQISKKAMKRMCRQHYDKMSKLSEVAERKSINHQSTDAPTPPTTDIPKSILRKRCSGDVSFSEPVLIGTRPNSIGSAMRDGQEWYVTEFEMGYSILQFSSSKSLNHSEPRSIHTLPYPFHGSDATVHNSTVYYNYGSSLVSYNLKNGATREIGFQMGQVPLFSRSSSLIDIQIDEHGLWVLYRKPVDNTVSVSRLVPASLKILSSWSLPDLPIDKWCNSFIRCGILYSVDCSIGARLSPVYDFYQNMHINGKETLWTDLGNLSSVQYDPRSKSIAIFAAGKIYNVQTY